MPSDRTTAMDGGGGGGDRSIIDSLGAEITAVISPVSICMLLVVLLVSSLSPPSSSSSAAESPITAANLFYRESPSDSALQKLSGSLLNAAAFVAIAAAATFLIVLLYYYNLAGCLRYYMRFSAFATVAAMGGPIALSLLRRLSLPLDAATALILLFNLSAVGAVAVLSTAVPIVLRQGYSVALAAIIAAWFALLPEWTTWTLLLALAAYDLVAVLAPNGPLRLLVELASSRDDDDLPALLYECRPSVPSPPASVELQPVHPNSNSSEIDNAEEEASLLVANEAATRDPEITEGNPSLSANPNSLSSYSGHSVVEIENDEEERSPLVEQENKERNPFSQLEIFDTRRGSDDHNSSGYNSGRSAIIEIENAEEERSPLVANDANTRNLESSEGNPSSALEMFDDSKRGIRLGLGDFVFYSVLVGRASMYDLMTVYACYLAIISGLGCTLILLSVRRHALPALPISIVLGMGFYFLTRMLMEPFVVGASTGLVMF